MGEHYDYWGGDAAAMPVPDTEDDTLRQALTTTIGNHTVPIKATLLNGEQTWPASIHILIGESGVAELADALLPLIREHVAAAEQAERERADAWRELSDARSELLACYRMGTRPSEKLHCRLDAARTAVDRMEGRTP